ncbi:MAG: DMT family transporter [Ruminiclostridium sp.]|nr:DMT family transporter [Ruminiclostridium sp.]
MSKLKLSAIPDKYKGIILIIASAFCFTVMNSFVRLAGDLPSIQKSFFRNAIAFAFALVVLLKSGKTLLPSKKSNIGVLILRATCGTIGILCNFYAVDNLVLSDATMLSKMSPFFAVVFSLIFLREKTTLVQTFGVIIAFIGSLFIIKPTFANMELIPSVIGLIGGIAAGAAYTAVRCLGLRGEKGSYIVFFFSGFSCLITLPFLILGFKEMTPEQWLILIIAGLAGAGGQFTITAAYRYAPAREISVYDYSQIIFAAIFGFFMFGGELPDLLSILGYIIICGMAVGMFIYNNRKSRKNE